jgi:hypothetical protein
MSQSVWSDACLDSRCPFFQLSCIPKQSGRRLRSECHRANATAEAACEHERTEPTHRSRCWMPPAGRSY